MVRVRLPRVLVAAAVISALALAGPPGAAAVVTDAVDSADPAVTYSGTWDTFSSSTDVGGSRVVGRTAGSTATIPFNASRVQLIGARAANLGNVEISIDGSVVAVVDTYSASTQMGALLFDSGPLASGSHVMKLRVTGTKNASSSNIFVVFDALVYGSRLLLEHDAELPDDAFFGALDLNRPGLAAVRDAVEDQNWPAARSALATAMKTRTSPQWLQRNGARPAPVASFNTTIADAIAAGTVYSQGSNVGDLLGSNQNYFYELADAYWWTGKSTYAQKLAGYIRDTAELAKPQRDLNPLTNALQAGAWIHAWMSLRDSAAFGPDHVVAYLKSMLARARRLNAVRRTVYKRGNIPWMIVGALAHVGIMFPEFKEAPTWRANGVADMLSIIQQDVYPDGTEKELATHYHGVFPQYLLGIGLLAEANGHDASLMYTARGRAMVAYLKWLVRPDGSIPMLGDSDRFLTQQTLGGGATYVDGSGKPEYLTIAEADPAHHTFAETPETLLARAATIYGDPTLVPTFSSKAFTYGGQAFQRSGSKSLLFDAGPYGIAHFHEDKLSIDLHAFGHDLIVDPGRFTYTRSNAFYPFFRSTAAHSTVMVNGQGQNRYGLTSTYETATALTDFEAESTTTFDNASGNYDDGYGPGRDKTATHEREVYFAKPDYWIVTDRLLGAGTATTEARFQFAPGTTTTAADRPAVTFTTADGDAGVVVDAGAGDSASVSVLTGAQSPAIAGWFSPSFGVKYPAPVAMFKRSGALPHVSSTLVVPFEGAQAPAVSATRLEPARADGAPLPAGVASALAVRRAGARDTFVSSSAPGTSLRFGGALSDGATAWVSSTHGGRPVAFALRDGALLSAPDGTELVRASRPLQWLSGRVDGVTLALSGDGLPPRLELVAPPGVSRITLEGRQVPAQRTGDGVVITTR